MCRFISLGEMGGLDRWFYAFSITPAAPSPPVPANATPSPFSAVISTARGTKRPYGAAAGGDQQDVNEFGIPNYIFEQAGAGKRRTGGGGGSAPYVEFLLRWDGLADEPRQAQPLHLQHLPGEGTLDPRVPLARFA